MYKPESLLKQGCYGQDVENVQACLYALGYIRNIYVNGKFDLVTEEAIKEFQYNAEIAVDGKVGSVTWNALVSAVEKCDLGEPKSHRYNLSDFVSADDKYTMMYGVPKWTWRFIKKQMDKWEIVCDTLGVEVKFRTGYRSPEYNNDVGSKAGSQHIQGRAVDPYVVGKDGSRYDLKGREVMTTYELYMAIMQHETLRNLFSGIGKGSMTNGHYDDRWVNKPGRIIDWYYKPNTSMRYWEQASNAIRIREERIAS